MRNRQPDFTLHIEPSEADLDAVPAEVLVQILEHAQRAFQLIGLHVEGRGIKQRARIAKSTSSRFQLICKVAEPGSYALPIAVGPLTDIFDEALTQRATTVFEDLFSRVSAKNAAGLHEILPDQLLLRKVLEAFKGMAPRAGAGWSFNIRDRTDKAFAYVDHTAIPFLQETLTPADQREGEMVVTGELKSIDFTARKLTIIYRPTSRALDCLYDESIEDLLYERRRDLIQVTGRVLLDDQGNPCQIIDVSDIADIDLSPIVLSQSRQNERVLRFNPPLMLTPVLDESEQIIYVEDSNLGVDAYACTRDSLVAELVEQLDILWQEYALADDQSLDEFALRRKQVLVHRIEEVKDAA